MMRTVAVLAVSGAMVTMIACSQGETTSEETTTMTQEQAAINIPSLQDQLDEMRANWSQRADEETKTAFDEGVRLVGATGVLGTAKNVGDAAPDFTLANAMGDQIALSTLLSEGPVVLTWYRGGWCPYCNLQLRSMQEVLPELHAAGAQFVALSPELPDSTMSTKEKSMLEYQVLSDIGNAVGKQYGIVYELPEIVKTRFQGRLDIPGYNGDESWELPLAATYVIDTDGAITYAFVDEDYRKRAEPSTIVAEVKKLAEKKQS